MNPSATECIPSPQGQGWRGLCEFCGCRASVRVWASECPGAPRRKVDESRHLCPRCADLARGKAPARLAPRLEDLPPVSEVNQESGRRAGRPVQRSTPRSQLLLAIADGVRVEDLAAILGVKQGAVSAGLYNARRAHLLNDLNRLTRLGLVRVAELRINSPAASPLVTAGAPLAPGVVSGAGAHLPAPTAPLSSSVDGAALPSGGDVAPAGDSGGPL